MEHIQAAGYPVRVEDVDDIDAVKRRLRIPSDAVACHTAQVDGYLLEGHVPAESIDRMLAERPEVTGLAGLAVPGMPPRSPGMALPGEPVGGFEVVSFDGQGRLQIYERR